MFIGQEVEKTPALGLKTLFVIGVQDHQEIIKKATENSCTHIYFGANHSFDTSDYYPKWIDMIVECLKNKFWCTLDVDISFTAIFTFPIDFNSLKYNLCSFENFIPMISAKVPYISKLNPNATLKIDDFDFEFSNAGVWCHRLETLQSSETITYWNEYTKDEIIE